MVQMGETGMSHGWVWSVQHRLWCEICIADHRSVQPDCSDGCVVVALYRLRTVLLITLHRFVRAAGLETDQKG